MTETLLNKESDLGESGYYTSNLLGNIRSHLQGLQGFNIMALELIQNADDAEAKEIIFEIQDQGLRVWNSGTFTYCRNLEIKPCPHQKSGGYSCDFHRISDFGSGGKLSRSENIGRFGIGFSSTYQITDHPEIYSAGIKLRLVPEEGKCYRWPKPEKNGTIFYLPWATDRNSPGRQALGVSHVTQEHIKQLTQDYQHVLRHSLLFLRHLKKAELRENGKVLLTVELDRGDNAELIASFEPEGEVERWFIVRADAAPQVEPVYERYPQLKQLGRKTEVSVAIRVDPEPLKEGLLYAFLPTKQSTGMPLHLNADFFPEDNRKAIIFEGHQHQQEWNELLVRSSAHALADDLIGLRDRLGHVQLWELLSAALIVEQDDRSRFVAPLKSFWEFFKVAIDAGAEVGYSQKGEYKSPSDLLMPKKALSNEQLSAFHQIGGELSNEALRPHYNALIKLGVKDLTLERFLTIASQSLSAMSAEDEKTTLECLDSFFQPLWAIVEDLLPDTVSPSDTAQQAVCQLKKLVFVVDAGLRIATIDECYRAPVGITADGLSVSFPFLKFVNDRLASFPKLFKLVDHFHIGRAAGELEAYLDNDEIQPHDAIGDGPKSLYILLSKIDETGEDDEDAYKTLRRLPIWLTGNGVSSLEDILLPGDFEDPTGQGKLLDQRYLSDSVKNFIQKKLRVKRQTIEEYVRKVTPRYFDGSGPDDISAYKRLILSLADHAGLLDNDEIRSLLEETPLAPASDGSWKRANQLYYRADELTILLGDYKSLWVDESRLPSERSVQTFIQNLGLLKSPVAEHLVDRILTVSKSSPPDTKARKASEIAFYALCDIYDEENGDIKAEVNRLMSVPCLPVDGDTQKWYMPEETYAPFRYQAFQSQAPILDFKNTQKLNSGLLEALSINTKAETHLVVDHLLYCVDSQEPASNFVYQILNERAKQKDSELSRLRGERCIYLGALEKFVRPNQLYFIPQNLGKYSFSVPGELDQYKDLFTILGIKNEPEPQDYIDIILDIVEENYPRQSYLSSEDYAIYQHCMNELVQASDINEKISTEHIARLQQAPTILSVTGIFCHPDEVLRHDSEWLAGYFDDELSPMLCRPDPAWWPFFTELGVVPLTRRASVDLEYTDGEEQEEEQIRDKMLERNGVFARMLHDKPVKMCRRLVSVLQNISVLSYDEVRIVASVTINDDRVSSEPKSVKAFCDESMEKLVLARPVEERIWLRIFNVLLHRLMPEASASNISSISMNFVYMVSKSVADADEFLTEANIPLLAMENNEGIELDLASEELSDIGETKEDETDIQVSDAIEESDSQLTELGEDINDEGKTANRVMDNQPVQEDEQESVRKENQAPNGGTHVGSPRRKPRERHPTKKMWDIKLISYVKKLESNGVQGLKGSDSDTEYRLSIEAAAREKVCTYERERGRDPEEMAQTHPGYDIISRRVGDDEVDRYIEVKGTSGEWGNRGVSISRLQFSEAQNHGDKYWLYVVEHALNESCARIHPIQSPAMKVDSFMFDGEWRKVAINEASDPALRYTEGTRIDCLELGEAVIEKVEKRGQTISLLVNFGQNGGKKQMPLNLTTMKIIEEKGESDNTRS